MAFRIIHPQSIVVTPSSKTTDKNQGSAYEIPLVCSKNIHDVIDTARSAARHYCKSIPYTHDLFIQDDATGEIVAFYKGLLSPIEYLKRVAEHIQKKH